jgi:hypothetical protein
MWTGSQKAVSSRQKNPLHPKHVEPAQGIDRFLLSNGWRAVLQHFAEEMLRSGREDH